MICRQCRTSILSRLQPQSTTRIYPSPNARQLQWQNLGRRNYSDEKQSVAPSPPPAPRPPVVGDISVQTDAPPSATGEVSQPSITPEAGSAPAGSAPAGSAPAEKPTSASPASSTVKRPASSCVAGTKLNGLDYIRNKPEVFAKEDSEYPEWLWGLLDDVKKHAKSESGGVDMSTLNKKQRKRHEKKMAARAAAEPIKIPSHHQAADITPASYNQEQPTNPMEQVAESLEKRTEVTKSARASRRREIKESNFLRGM